MNNQSALSLPFDEYIAWCWQFFFSVTERYPFAWGMLENGGDIFLEACWARAYWFNQAKGAMV